jgi:hypothetical protein
LTIFAKHITLSNVPIFMAVTSSNVSDNNIYLIKYKHFTCDVAHFFATITVDITTIILLSHIRPLPRGRKQGRKQVHGPAHSLTGYQTYPRHPGRIMHERRMEILTPFMSSFLARQTIQIGSPGRPLLFVQYIHVLGLFPNVIF